MKRPETALVSVQAHDELKEIGAKVARLRRARRMLQAHAALRAGISRPVAVAIEAGDPGRTLGQIARYLEAIAPGTTLSALLLEQDPALATLRRQEATQRVRRSRAADLKALDF